MALAASLIFCLSGESDPRTKLFFSSSSNNLSSAVRLIEKGVDVNSRDALGSTPLHAAESPTMALLLLESGANPNAVNDSGITPLYAAAKRSDLRLATMLLEHGADSNWNENGMLALFEAATLEMAEALVNHGADVNAQNAQGLTPLHMAVARCRMDVARFLLEQGAEVNACEKSGGNTALHFAMSLAKPDMAEMLIGHGAHVDSLNKLGMTPLHYAARKGMFFTVRALLLHGANPTIISATGENSFDLSVLSGNPSVESLLRQSCLIFPRQLGDDVLRGDELEPGLLRFLSATRARRLDGLGLTVAVSVGND